MRPAAWLLGPRRTGQHPRTAPGTTPGAEGLQVSAADTRIRISRTGWGRWWWRRRGPLLPLVSHVVHLLAGRLRGAVGRVTLGPGLRVVHALPRLHWLLDQDRLVLPLALISNARWPNKSYSRMSFLILRSPAKRCTYFILLLPSLECVSYT